MTKSLCELIKKYEDDVNFDGISFSFRQIDEFIYKHKEVIKMEEYEELIEVIEENLCPFLTKEKAEYYVKKVVNSDGTIGPHYTMEQVLNTLENKHIAKETENYNFYDLYTQVILVYSDLGPIVDFDVDKMISISLAYLNDKDFPGRGKMSYTKWYCEAKEKLSEEME